MAHLPQVFSPDVSLTTLQRLCGPLDTNLHDLCSVFAVKIQRNDNQFTLTGEAAPAAKKALESLLPIAIKREIDPTDIRLAAIAAKDIHSMTENHTSKITLPEEGQAGAQLRTRRGYIGGRTPRQSSYIRALLQHDVVFGLGPAGTGKTYLAVAAAVDAMERHLVDRIVLVRPAVEAGEKLGFLPGDFQQKVDPYLRPLFDALYDLMGAERMARLQEKGLIEIAPLAYMRGRTLNSAFIILDEAQNTTPEQMKMFLTRIGFGAKAVITGDLSQIDLPRHITSGLRDAVNILHDVDGLYFHHFTSEDVVRHPLVQKIVNAYEACELQAEKDKMVRNQIKQPTKQQEWV